MVKSFYFNSLLVFLVVFSNLALAAEEAMPADSALERDMGYFYGFSFGNMLKDGGSPNVDVESLLKGLNDSLANNPPALADDRREKVYQEVRARQLRTQEVKKAAQDAQEKVALAQVEINLANAEAFLAENATRKGVQTTPSGLQYEVLVEAGGKRPIATSRVSVTYVGSFVDGGVFDQSGDNPVEFGLEQVVVGWTEGLQLMGIGDKFRFYLHPDLAYGAGSVGPIPPNSLLVFEVELLAIK
ncbi:MAG: FKBP-type peptidyl-prolyl cis-trans isomerase [Pseudomonadales bacterium]|jgi:FKBP-type peptidyl-prolyl cis-trans isomerase|nr:FKBP-type peptidyl-prolyl cis-trans isomerase [Pseudomonadales bacterium]